MRSVDVLGWVLAVSLAGCGYSQQEWNAQLAKNQKLEADQRSAETKLATVQRELAAEQQRVAELTRSLRAAGIEIEGQSAEVGRLSTTLEDRERALAEYRARARQLEAIRARFEVLRRKLDELTALGLAVNIRKNRMIISLPGDVLFDSGKETLKKEGKDILTQVAGVIKNDPGLVNRDYQVGGHTDNKPLEGGKFKDNWGLSLMRAREVLVYLVGDKGGQLPVAHWSAAGFADTDPVAANDGDDGRKKNRRCELVVVPSVEEMLDLKSLATQPVGGSATPAGSAPAPPAARRRPSAPSSRPRAGRRRAVPRRPAARPPWRPLRLRRRPRPHQPLPRLPAPRRRPSRSRRRRPPRPERRLLRRGIGRMQLARRLARTNDTRNIPQSVRPARGTGRRWPPRGACRRACHPRRSRAAWAGWSTP
ncbi:MAG: OmpA family protein [Polyangiaceae bacterium]